MTPEAIANAIQEIENVWIPMADGCRLAARVWLPRDAHRTPVPAVLEYIPYRKRDFMRSRDEPIHRYFAAHGYASVRVDVRGSGDSDGVLRDEYTQQEHDDALQILRWISAQPWCAGKVGMMGISWGGFNSLQVAALRPPELKAVITLCSTDDRYADDAHYMGGCLLNENMQWGSILLHYCAYPPDPHIVGERWRSMWQERLEALAAFPVVWMQHPWRDEYWRHGSVCENYGAIECPVYAIGGWADGYSNAIPRLLQGLPGPRKGLVGPWAHVFPHNGVPGPAIGFLQEALRWWDHWLKGIDTGVMNEPQYRVWMQESVPPQPHYEERPGRWVAEAAWPSTRIQMARYHLLEFGRLDVSAGEPAQLGFSSPQTTGLKGGEWCAFGADGEMPLDQRPDDGRSLTFDSEPLAGIMELLGAPVVRLTLVSDKPQAMIAVRLNDIAPDGESTLVTYGLLNLSHRDGHQQPVPLVPGERYAITLALNDIAHALPAGHRIRLAISTAYWPTAWPSPEAATLILHTAESNLELPVRPPSDADVELRAFDPPQAAPADSVVALRALPLRRSVELDLATNETVYTLNSDGGELGGASLARIDAIDMEVGYTFTRRHRIKETEPLSAQTEVVQRTIMRRSDWVIRIETRTLLTATQEDFQFNGDVEAFEGEENVAHRTWRVSVPRKGV